MAEEEIKNTTAEATDEVKATEEQAKVAAPKSKANKGKRIVNSGEVHIQSTFNNTIIVLLIRLVGY